MLAQPSSFYFCSRFILCHRHLKRKPCCSDYISVLLYFLKRIFCFVFTLSLRFPSNLKREITKVRGKLRRLLGTGLLSHSSPEPSSSSSSSSFSLWARALSREHFNSKVYVQRVCETMKTFEERFIEAFLPYQKKMDSNNLWFDLLVLLTPSV